MCWSLWRPRGEFACLYLSTHLSPSLKGFTNGGSIVASYVRRMTYYLFADFATLLLDIGLESIVTCKDQIHKIQTSN